MATQQTAATQALTPELLGELTAKYAPDVPPEVVGAVFKQESSWGTNQKIYQAEGVKGVKGVGQIQTAPGTHIKGQPQSLAEGMFPKSLGQFDVNNQIHLAISSLVKMNEDWAKGKGNASEFSKRYFGGGRDNTLNMTATDYTSKLVPTIESMKSDPKGQAFLAATNNPKVRAMPAPSYSPGSVAGGVNSLADIATSGRAGMEAAAKELQFNLEALISTTKTAGLAEAERLSAELNATNEFEKRKAAQANQVLDLFGMNVGTSNSFIRNQAQNMQTLLADGIGIIQDTQKRISSNPILAILDGISGNKYSAGLKAEGVAKIKEAELIGNSIDQLAARAKNAMAIGDDTLVKTSNAVIEAKRKEALAKAERDVAKLNYEGGKAMSALERQFNQFELATFRSDINMQQQVLNLEKKQQEIIRLQQQTAQAELTNPDRAELLRLQADAAKEQLEMLKAKTAKEVKAATALGKSTAEVKMLAKSDARVAGMLDDDLSAPSFSTVQYLRDNNKLDQYSQKAFSNFFLDSRSPFYGKDAIDPKSVKSAAEIPAAKNTAIVNRGLELQSAIVNDGSKSAITRNPYAANFWNLASGLPAGLSQQTAMLATKAANTDLVKTLAAQYGKNSADRTSVGDQEVLSKAVELAKTGGVAAAANEVALYYKAQMAVNNEVHGFKLAGIPEQIMYRVPIKLDATFLAKFLFAPGPNRQEFGGLVEVPESGTKITTADGQPKYRPVDLSDPAIVMSEILSRLVKQ